MIVLLVGMSIAMMVGGGAAVYFGAPIIAEPRGWAMVVAGAVAASAGAIVLAVANLTRRLAALAADAKASRPASPEPQPGPLLPGLAARAEDRGANPAGVAPSPGAPEGPPPANLDSVVGSYSAGGASYEMFADGSIRVETPDGEQRFASMGEFRAFAAAKGGPLADAGQAASRPTARSAKA